MNDLVPDRGALRTWVELYGPQSEAKEETHLGAAIALISAAVGWKAWIRWGENAEPCTVNVVLEGRSATARKTTVAGSAHSIAREAMKTVDEDNRGLRTRSIGHTSNRGLLEAVATKSAETAERWETEPPPGLLLVWDEFGAVLGEPGEIKGASWLGQVRATLMQLAGGRHGGIQTGGDKLPPARCAVSILATMTRAELEQRVTAGLLRDGFMGRFILIPYSGRSRLLSEPPTWTPAMQRQRGELVQWVWALAQTRGELGDVFAHLTDGAREERQGWYQHWTSTLEGQNDDEGDETGRAALEAFGRLQTTALKVATIAAVAEWAPPTALWQIQIDRQHVAWGQRLAELCLAEVMDLEQLGGPLRDRYAERVKALLQRAGPMSKAELLDRCRMSQLTRLDRWNVIRELHPEDVEISEEKSGGRPRLLVTATMRSVSAVKAPDKWAENGSN